MIVLLSCPRPLVVHGRCLQCFECPWCSCVLAPSLVSFDPISCSTPAPSKSTGGPAGPAPYCFRCLYCRWSSEDVGLVASGPAALSEAASAGEKQRENHAFFDALLALTKKRELEALRESGGFIRRGGGRPGERTGRIRTAPLSPPRSGAGIPTGPWKVMIRPSFVQAIVQRRRALLYLGLPPSPLSLVLHESPSFHFFGK